MTGKTITSNSAAGYNLGDPALNPVSVASGVTLSNVNLPALYSLTATYWTIVNAGSLLATGTSTETDGILLNAGGGSVTNATSGSITGDYVGVSVQGTGTVVNQGTITTMGTTGSGFSYQASGSFTAISAGVIIGGGGASNAATGLISGYFEGIAIGGGGSVVNAGTIVETSHNDGFGVVLTAGGSLTNLPNGSITSGRDAVLAFGPAPTIINQGYIGGLDNLGVALISGGVVTNASTGTIYGYDSGVESYGTGQLTMTNAANGTIAGHDFGLYARSGNVTTLTNDGLIIGYTVVGVVLFDTGTISNGSAGRIAGYDDGVFTSGSGPSTVINTGTLFGDTYAGAWLQSGGSLSNAGTIFGQYFGVKVSTAGGSVVNAGYISDAAVYKPTDTAFASAGVQLAAGGIVTNSAGGHITSEWMGVQIGGALTSSIAGTVFNQGTIIAADAAGDGAGIWIHGPGLISNAAGGVISGGGFGIVAYYQTTVVNQGTVFGTDFAFLATSAGFADRIIDLPGGVFSGAVSGGNTIGSAISSTLELASGSSTGTIVNIGTFTDFGQIALDAGATWSLGGTIAGGETVVFDGAQASLILAAPSAAAAATLAGFTATDTIVLSGITDVTGLSFNGDTLEVTESSGPGLTLQFDAAQTLAHAVVNGSTDLFVPCFLPGTHILTDRGEVPVEKLQVGDTVVTLSGQMRRLCWIGQGRTLATRGRRTAATPVIVRKGALADNVPYNDLRITKGHALYLDGVLIPAEFLVNHRSILWDDRAQEVTVFHLELETHDVLLANGAAAESYRDDGNRWLFQNANDGWDQPPKPPCAPVLTGGARIDAIWRRLLDRAGPRPGVPLTDDPDLHLLVDGVRVDPVQKHGPVHLFRLDGCPAFVQIASREAVPAELGLARDPRPLGVAIRHVAIRQNSKFLLLEADDPRLADGFHAYERSGRLRWTNGRATLPAGLFAPFETGMEIVLHLAGTTRYRNDGFPVAA